MPQNTQNRPNSIKNLLTFGHKNAKIYLKNTQATPKSLKIAQQKKSFVQKTEKFFQKCQPYFLITKISKSPEITDQNPQCGQNVEKSSKIFSKIFKKYVKNHLQMCCCCCCIMAIEKKNSKKCGKPVDNSFSKKGETI